MAQATKPLTRKQREKRNAKLTDWYQRNRVEHPGSVTPKEVRHERDRNDSK